ncbi:hypothetical protein [Paenibacillus sp. YN15]|uniref:hypothetical protein n=1 Tax=Paenibacillus sp. YN15 TaxID=1742774 RepID=UPI000DCBAE07|nr:hypothetical protein [Paenibacillus sp. YN15]RAU93045.1 hypothetical protein DQG13_26285 [Paenibacillus sp. YN15]
MNGEQAVIAFGQKDEGREYKERPAVYAVILNEHHEVAVVRSRGRLLLPGCSPSLQGGPSVRAHKRKRLVDKVPMAMLS